MNIFWFRQDLRISDNPGFFAACQDNAVMPIYILDDEAAGEFKMGAASRWWLHHALIDLNKSLNHKLNIYCGHSKTILQKILNEHAIKGIYWNRCYEPWRVQMDTEIKAYLKENELECQSFKGSLLFEPWEILKEDKTPYKVFTPFYRKARSSTTDNATDSVPLSKPKIMNLFKDPKQLQSNDKPNHAIEKLALIPKVHWYKTMENHLSIGENAAQKRLAEFLESGLQNYEEDRNFPDKKNVSRLSPYLHFGEISPRQIWFAVQTKSMQGKFSNDAEIFLKEIIWREFSYYLLYHFKNLPRQNFQKKFDHFPWEKNAAFLAAWQQGQTGYPIVDAGMRELWQTGYMHNRVRMIVASFLVKNLLQHWHHGEDWFWDCLVDADLANNSASWQWVAGSGADAAPYFRIFNPITQGEKFDKEGHYTRRFVPELRKLPDKYLFKPWMAPDAVLKEANIVLGKNYPKPIVNLEQSRDLALQAYQSIL